MTNRHVALACWGLPPFRGSGVYRPLALANGLVARGARVTAIGASRETFLLHYGADPLLESQIDPRINVVRLPFYPRRTWPLVNDWPRSRVSSPKAYWSKPDPDLDLFPEKGGYANWIPQLLRGLEEAHAKDPIDLILASSAPYADAEAAVLAGSALGIPVILDDRDAFIADVFTGDNHELFEERLPYFEKWIRQCTEMWFVNPPIQKWHAERFPAWAHKFRVVENGWDPGVVNPARSHVKAGSVNIGYVGLLPPNFPLDEVLETWTEVHTKRPDAKLHFVGPLGFSMRSKTWRNAEEKLATCSGVHWRGHISRTELTHIYDELDVLLYVKEGGSLVTGGKAYEYGATGLPIILLSDPKADVRRVLGQRPRTYAASHKTKESAVQSFLDAINDHLTDNGTRFDEALEYGATLERSHVLDPVIKRVLGMVES